MFNKKNKKNLYDENGNLVKGAKVKKPFYLRWWFIALVIIVVSVALFGGEDDESDTSDTASTEDVVENVEAEDTDSEEELEEEVAEEPKEKEASNVGKRSNPVPLGTAFQFEDTYSDDDFNSLDAVFELTVLDVIRGDEAYDILVSENQFNEPAPEGMEWAIISLEGRLIEGDEDVPYTVVPWFSVVDSSGSEISQDDYGTFDGNEYGYVDLFPGGTTTGRIAKYIPLGDDTLLVLDEFWGSGIYFSLK